ncbi:MAG TPA: xylulokinase [Lentisphaeria bacterium]|nr:MAG: xylulokinase [Lentisphaerae bacterium GWF2_38_69]HBM15247.1 xylulokinase [Lentisphaeria bacterium]
MNTVLGIDVGTQSVKTIFYDFEDKRIIAEASAPLELISADDGTREQKARWYIDAIKKSLSQIDPKIKLTAVAAGVSGQQHGFVPLDNDGNVLYNVKLWCDTSTAQECREIAEAFEGGEQALLDEVGNLILPGYTIPKVLWLKKHKPQLYAKLDTILLPHDYINYYLTGNKVMEYGDASGTGCLNIRIKKWSEKILKAVDPSQDLIKKLPNLISAETPCGRIKADIARQLELPKETIVSSGGGDNMMGAIGTGAVSKGVITMSLGTSGTLYGYSDIPIIDRSLAAFCSSTNGYLPLLCTMNCTISLELTRALLNTEISEIEKLLADTKPGSDGIITLPFYNGERSPNLPGGKGCILGLTMNNMNKANILRSSMEATIFGMKYGLDTLRDLGFQPKEIRLTGGGSKSRIWRQMASDIFELPIVVPEIQEGAAFGAALQALWSYQVVGGEKISIQAIAENHVKLDSSKGSFPVMENMKIYKSIYSQYNKYLETLRPTFC